jgi:tRNA A-37 threonylcarbamoyl transferase component Bud32
MALAPLQTFRASTNRAWLLEEEGKRWLVKNYIGEHAEQRRDCETRRLTLWAHHGFRVPILENRTVNELKGEPHVVMEFIEGPTVQEVLRDMGQSKDNRLRRLRSVLAENRRRHGLVQELHEPGLLHHDPNTSNLLCLADGSCCFIDFEAEVAGWQIEFIAIEIAKLFRWAARDLGRPDIDSVGALMVEAYADRKEWLKAIVQRTVERPLQFLHRWQDDRRKMKSPGEVTKYDVADCLARLL